MTNDSIKKIDDNQMYVATIKFYSRGNDQGVATMFEVSHVLDDQFEGEIPSCYGAAQEVVLNLRRTAMLYAATGDDAAYLNDPNVSEEDRVARVLESSKAQEEALKATIN
jgi:hypothetical protein